MNNIPEYDQNLRLRCDNAPWRRSVEFLLRQGNDKVARVEFVDIDHGRVLSPSFELRPEHAQELMDELWACGFRPTEGTGSAGALAATQRHLDDMRKLVFDSSEIRLTPPVQLR